MIDYIQIGKRIRYYRIQLGLTQESLAFEIQTSAAYVSCIERGTKKPSLQKLVEIADILGISVEDLLSCSSQEWSGQSLRQKEPLCWLLSSGTDAKAGNP